MIPFVDIHTHKKYTGDISVYSYMAGSGEPLPEIPYSTGIHPWKLDGAKAEWLDESITPLTVAIGETGLDYAAAESAGINTEGGVAAGMPAAAAAEAARGEQRRMFRFHLGRAQELGLPVIIHCVKAYNELIPIVKEYSVMPIIHGFTGPEELAAQLLDAGFYLSFGAGLLRSPKTQKAIRIVPTDRLFFETDTSDMAIGDIYAAGAGFTGCEMETLKKAVYDNYKNIFAR